MISGQSQLGTLVPGGHHLGQLFHVGPHRLLLAHLPVLLPGIPLHPLHHLQSARLLGLVLTLGRLLEQSVELQLLLVGEFLLSGPG